ncbi:hypothetical protein [Streptomyces sp. NL15-2K]|uniref:hypothetical protein n=1 Tax=Streptomyces sp. NL15-2K TaxID=376149 RepID=UPI000FF982A4|nr:MULTISPECIES: hypothetical protein [Actinomycetes]WKX09499.1 hypothetical protein Q4V64_19190 [Kutzneria buriramensis]GCB48992.1 hypothetical protein SNL152K_6322 [Streptomyces sp. NL15-2K]
MLFLLVMLLVVVLSITACALLGRGCGSLAEKGLRRTSLPKALRGFASISGAGAVAVYAWGLLGVAGAIMEAEDGGTDSAPNRACRTSGWLERERSGDGIVDYSVSWAPLDYVCETKGGGSYTTDDVPGYVNPAVVGFGLAAAGCAISAGYVTELRLRGGGARGEGETRRAGAP